MAIKNVNDVWLRAPNLLDDIDIAPGLEALDQRLFGTELRSGNA